MLHLITYIHTYTLGRTPPGERSALRRDLYLITHNTHKRKTSMLPAGPEPAISANQEPLTHALDRAAIGIAQTYNRKAKIFAPGHCSCSFISWLRCYCIRYRQIMSHLWFSWQGQRDIRRGSLPQWCRQQITPKRVCVSIRLHSVTSPKGKLPSTNCHIATRFLAFSNNRTAWRVHKKKRWYPAATDMGSGAWALCHKAPK